MKKEIYIETIKRLQDNANRIDVFDDHDYLRDMILESLSIAEVHKDYDEWIYYKDLIEHIDGLYNGYQQLSKDVISILPKLKNSIGEVC